MFSLRFGISSVHMYMYAYMCDIKVYGTLESRSRLAGMVMEVKMFKSHHILE